MLFFFFNYFPTPPCSLLLKSQKSKTNQLGCIKSQKHVKNDTLSAIVWKKTNGCIKKISTATIEDISIFSVKPWILGGTRLSNLNLKLKIVVIFRSSAWPFPPAMGRERCRNRAVGVGRYLFQGLHLGQTYSWTRPHWGSGTWGADGMGLGWVGWGRSLFVFFDGNSKNCSLVVNSWWFTNLVISPNIGTNLYDVLYETWLYGEWRRNVSSFIVVGVIISLKAVLLKMYTIVSAII